MVVIRDIDFMSELETSKKLFRMNWPKRRCIWSSYDVLPSIVKSTSRSNRIASIFQHCWCFLVLLTASWRDCPISTPAPDYVLWEHSPPDSHYQILQKSLELRPWHQKPKEMKFIEEWQMWCKIKIYKKNKMKQPSLGERKKIDRENIHK